MALLKRTTTLRGLCLVIVLGGCTILRSADDVGDGLDGGVCQSPCTCLPTVSMVGPAVAAHGARIVISGTCLTDVDRVTLGGVEHGFAHAEGALVVDEVSDMVTVGMDVPLVVRSPRAESDARGVVVAHLVVNEIDTHTGNGNNDDEEFVELATGLSASLDLTGYAVLFVSGNDPETYADVSSIALATGASNGRYIVGNASVDAIESTFPNGSLGEGMGMSAHAVMIVQTADLPARRTRMSTLDVPIIDAIVYSKDSASPNQALLALCFPDGGARVQVAENGDGDSERDALVRCGTARRDGRVYSASAPTPDAPNTCP